MTTTTQRESAKIYQFPARGRFAASTQDAPPALTIASRPPKTVLGGAWYHDAAIAEERPVFPGARR